MRPVRLAGLLSVVVLAVSLSSVVAASAAESSDPLFLAASGNPVGASVVGLSGPSTLTVAAGGRSITCQKDVATGTITSTVLLGKVIVHYLECTMAVQGPKLGPQKLALRNVPIKSVGSEGEGLILTNELHGILGLILSPAPLDTGILFLPTNGKIFASFAETTNGSVKCGPETRVTAVSLVYLRRLVSTRLQGYLCSGTSRRSI
jgi:hypothetical protein